MDVEAYRPEPCTQLSESLELMKCYPYRPEDSCYSYRPESSWVVLIDLRIARFVNMKRLACLAWVVHSYRPENGLLLLIVELSFLSTWEWLTILIDLRVVMSNILIDLRMKLAPLSCSMSYPYRPEDSLLYELTRWPWGLSTWVLNMCHIRSSSKYMKRKLVVTLQEAENECHASFLETCRFKFISHCFVVQSCLIRPRTFGFSERLILSLSGIFYAHYRKLK